MLSHLCARGAPKIGLHRCKFGKPRRKFLFFLREMPITTEDKIQECDSWELYSKVSRGRRLILICMKEPYVSIYLGRKGSGRKWAEGPFFLARPLTTIK